MQVKILIVDDEPMVRSSMARMMRSIDAQYTVGEAEDGEEALSMLARQSYDLVITDIRMPAMNGIELCKHIHQKYPRMHVVMLTGYADFSYAQAAIRYNVSEYLLKPVSVDAIKEVVRKIEVKLREKKNHDEIIRLRELHLLEKRVQDLFYEMPVPYCDEKLFPPFSAMAVLSFKTGEEALTRKTIRFAIKNILSEMLSVYGIPVVVVEESHISAVLFMNTDAFPEWEQLSGQIGQAMGKYQNIEVQTQFGGITDSFSGIAECYRISLEKLGIRQEPQEEVKPSAAVHRLIRQAQEIIQEEFSSELTLTFLAERLFVNPNYLSSLFKSETGKTFSQYLTQIRIEKAKELLRSTNLKIYQICDQVGYMDQAHFSRVFKSLEGLNPYDFREQYQK